MKNDIINKISALSLYAFADESKDGMLTVHFINEKSGKADIMAYFLLTHLWDVREVIEERAQVLPDREIIEIIQRPIGIYEKDSTFDKLMRQSLSAMSKAEAAGGVKHTLANELLSKIGYE
jgi:hypothetical protein